MTPRIKNISISGIRTLDEFSLDIDGFVLIGENGSGKSSIIEGCELLRRLANSNFHSEYISIHGGDSSLIRNGHNEIELGATVEGKPWTAFYKIRFNGKGISEETFLVSPEEVSEVRKLLIDRNVGLAIYTLNGEKKILYDKMNRQMAAIAHYHHHPDEIVQIVNAAFRQIDVLIDQNMESVIESRFRFGEFHQ